MKEAVFNFIFNNSLKINRLIFNMEDNYYNEEYLLSLLDLLKGEIGFNKLYNEVDFTKDFIYNLDLDEKLSYTHNILYTLIIYLMEKGKYKENEEVIKDYINILHYYKPIEIQSVKVNRKV